MTAKAEKLYNRISQDLLGEIKFGVWKQSAGNIKKETKAEPTSESMKKFEEFIQKKSKSNVLKPPSKKKTSK